MRTVTIVHRDPCFAQQLARALRTRGYQVIVCSPPLVTGVRCIQCGKASCPLTDPADLLICDPQLRSPGNDNLLVVETALGHPHVPILLAWSTTSVPDLGTLRAIRIQAPRMHVAARDPAALLRQVDDLLMATTGAKGNVR
jgi:hypothetical protein